MPINPIHLALMNNGQVLVVAGSGNDPASTQLEAGVWDPVAGSIKTQSLSWDMFCNGMINLWNGQQLIAGGTLQYGPFLGLPNASIYDPPSGSFSNLPNMVDGRWYPTLTELNDGSVMVFSGISKTGPTNNTVEIYNLNTGWSQPYTAPWLPPLYPRLHLLPNGNVFYSGSTSGARYFYPSSETWSNVVAVTNLNSLRTYGSSVLLPLSPANNYDPRVMLLGGGSPTATNTTEVIDLGAANPSWNWGPPMSQARVEMDAVLLPNGMLLALNGSATDEDSTTASLNADMIDPIALTVTPAGQETYPRLYHSGALLLPNATVAVVGGNPRQGSFERHVEIYSPPYLFNPDGSPAYRPQITSVTAGPIGYGASFQVQTPDAASIASAVLIPPGTPTHAFDNSAREVGLSFSQSGGGLNVIAPPNSSIAPPGYYMLFLVNNAGVPSVASFIQLPLPGASPTPTPSATPTPMPGLEVTPSTLSFGVVGIGLPTTAQAVTLTNNSSTVATIAHIANSNVGAIYFSNQCPTLIQPNASCTISVTFAPQHPGPRSETLTITDNAVNNPQVISITGTGIFMATPSATATGPVGGGAAITPTATAARPTATPTAMATATVTATPAPLLQVSPSSLTFGTVIIGSPGPSQPVTLTNASSRAVTISSIVTSNVGAIYFSSQCPTVLQPNAACTVSVSFAPQHPGPRSETVTITDTAANSPQVVSIAGTGIIAPTPTPTAPPAVTPTAIATPTPIATPMPVLQVTPMSLGFGTVTIGSSPVPQPVMLSNTSSTAVSISNITTSNVGAIYFSNPCPKVLQPNASCVVSVSFAPQHPGPRSETLTLTDTAANNPQVISITGTGVYAPTPTPAP